MIVFKSNPKRGVYICELNGYSELCKLSLDEFLELFDFGFVFVKWTLSFAGKLISSINYDSPLRDFVKSLCLLFGLASAIKGIFFTERSMQVAFQVSVRIFLLI